MFDVALNLVRDAAQAALMSRFGLPFEEELVSLTRLVQEGGAVDFPGHIGLTLLRVEREPSRGPAPMHAATAHVEPPPVTYRLEVLAVSDPGGGYVEALRSLGLFCAWVESQPLFAAPTHPELDAGAVERVSMALMTPPLGDQLAMWQVLGGSLRPSVMLELRVLTRPQAAGEAVSATSAVAEPVEDPTNELPQNRGRSSVPEVY